MNGLTSIVIIFVLLLAIDIPYLTYFNRNMIKDMLSYKNLSRLKFSTLSLNQYDFSHSRLDATCFNDCNLKNANFNGCYFKNTAFKNNSDLSGATIKGAILESIEDEGKGYYDQKEIAKYFYKKTQITLERSEPCQSTINLKRILSKLVRKGRGFKIPTKFISMTKCGGGITAEKCVKEAIRQGILYEEGEYIRIKNTYFDDVENFTKLNKIQSVVPLLKEILDIICPDTNLGCKHLG